MSARFLFLCLIVAMAAGGGSAADEPGGGTVRWMLTGVPPKLIAEGPFRGTGYGEQQYGFLTRHLPQFGHHLETVTPARLWHEMQSGGVCSIDIAEIPEREAWAVFSRHQTSYPSFRILVARDRLADFGEYRDGDGKIDLALLGRSTRLTGISVAGRHYMPEINKFIDDPGRKVRIDSMSASTKIFEMVAGRRGDFSFGTVAEMNYFNALNAAAPDGKAWPPVAMLAIKGVTAQVHGHIACSRDPLGRRVVEAIDRLLDDEALWKEFISFEQGWMEDVPIAGR